MKKSENSSRIVFKTKIFEKILKKKILWAYGLIFMKHWFLTISAFMP